MILDLNQQCRTKFSPSYRSNGFLSFFSIIVKQRTGINWSLNAKKMALSFAEHLWAFINVKWDYSIELKFLRSLCDDESSPSLQKSTQICLMSPTCAETNYINFQIHIKFQLKVLTEVIRACVIHTMQKSWRSGLLLPYVHGYANPKCIQKNRNMLCNKSFFLIIHH